MSDITIRKSLARGQRGTKPPASTDALHLRTLGQLHPPAGRNVVAPVDEEARAPGAVTFEAAELDALSAAGQHAEAVALYEGEFLDGLFGPGAPAFERWVEGEHARLKKRRGFRLGCV
ncbi:MAG: hypothetical protein ABI969_06400 [bacterium]